MTEAVILFQTYSHMASPHEGSKEQVSQIHPAPPLGGPASAPTGLTHLEARGQGYLLMCLVHINQQLEADNSKDWRLDLGGKLRFSARIVIKDK